MIGNSTGSSSGLEFVIMGVVQVSAFSTGAVRLRPAHVGPTRKPVPVWMLTSRRWTAPRPINVYVIEHHSGVVLFDTGQDRASLTDPGYFPRRIDRLVNSRLGQLEIGPAETLEAGLSGLGYRAGDIGTVVLSHLHPDHVGGLALFGRADVVVSRAEWQTLERPRPEARGLYREHVDLPGLTWRRIAPEPLADPALAPFTAGHDLLGDGSLVILPTPGHTAGSISMLVRWPGRAPLLMVGDLAYDDDRLAAGELSGMCNRRRTRESMNQVNALRAAMPDLVVLPAHDPGAGRRLAAVLAD